MPGEYGYAAGDPRPLGPAGPDRGRGSIPECWPGGLHYSEGFLDDQEAAQLLAELLETVVFERPSVHLFGRVHQVPRGVAYYGDPGCRYRYSGISHAAMPWLSPLADLRRRINAYLATACNAVLVTVYRDGSDRIGWHRDDEEDLLPGAPVVAVSLGACRRMLLRPRPGRSSIGLDLRSGSLLVLAGEALDWQHAIPPRRHAGLRVSLTYRTLRASLER